MHCIIDIVVSGHHASNFFSSPFGAKSCVRLVDFELRWGGGERMETEPPPASLYYTYLLHVWQKNHLSPTPYKDPQSD